MNSRPSHLIRTLLVCLCMSVGSLVSAQAAEGQAMLFSCDVRDSPMKVDLQLSGDQLTLRLGANLSDPDVSVTNTFAQTAYLPGAPTPLEHEQVTLIDAQGTTYAVSSSINWITRRVLYHGSLNIIGSGDEPQVMRCGSMSSQHSRLRSLAAHVTETPMQLIDRCLVTRPY